MPLVCIINYNRLPLHALDSKQQTLLDFGEISLEEYLESSLRCRKIIMCQNIFYSIMNLYALANLPVVYASGPAALVQLVQLYGRSY